MSKLARGHKLSPPRKNASSKAWGRYIHRLVTTLGACLSTLTPRARQILLWRAGVNGKRPLSQRQVARRLNISVKRERVLERNAAAALRDTARTGTCGTATQSTGLAGGLQLLPAGVRQDIVAPSVAVPSSPASTSSGATATPSRRTRHHGSTQVRIKTAASSLPTLPRSGSSATQLLLIALALLVACAMATLVGRQVLPARDGPARPDGESRPPEPKAAAVAPALVAPPPDPGGGGSATAPAASLAAGEAADLGALLAERGDLAGARDALRQADEQGDAVAASNLGVLLEQEGDIEGAAAAYRRADERGDANGAFNLGGLLAQQGDVAGALDAFARAAERGDSSAAASAGMLLEREGHIDAAIAAYREASQAGDSEASFNLGALLARSGDPAGAVAAYRQAARHGDEKLSRRARSALAALQASRKT